MKKIIVAIAMLLVATLALSVSAAKPADFGAETYYLGSPATTSPVLDGEFGANEYTVTYTLTKGMYKDKNGATLSVPADASAVTSEIKVGVAYDVENFYIAIESTLAANVATVDYTVAGISFTEANVTAKKVAYKQANGKFVGEVVIELTNNGGQAYNTAHEFVITETTKNAAGETLNKSVWNVIELTTAQKAEVGMENFAAVDYVTHTFVLGSESTLSGDVVTVEQPVIGDPSQTAPIVTEAPTTEAPTTEAPTTEAPTTEAPTTEAPTTEAPETTTEAPAAEGGCGSSVAAMGIALVAALGTCAVVVSKKED